MSNLKTLSFLVIFSCLSALSISSIYDGRESVQTQRISSLVFIPTTLVEALALEFKGTLSDSLMLNTLTFMGEKLINEEQLTKNEWQLVYHALLQITTLDPMATDPFILAATTLPYDAKMVEETNEILEKVALVRKHDHRPYFFLWHNYYNFLNDPKKAATYLEKAAKIPSAPSYYALLASRINLYAGDIVASILFTKEVLRETTDTARRKYLLLRLNALQKISFLEKHINAYKKQYKKSPTKLQDLIDCGLIPSIPIDPYGGKFYILEGGRVYSTSELVLTPKQKN